MSDIKQTNFRIGVETAKAFRAFCEENGMNQAQGFDYLMEVLALDKARGAIVSRETEIANFEQHAKAIVSLYLHSLELNENAEARVREQFASRLETQAITMAEYQQEIARMRETIEHTAAMEEAIRQEYFQLQKDLAASEEARQELTAAFADLKESTGKQIADKENIIAMLRAELEPLREKADEHEFLEARVGQLEADLAASEQTLRDERKDAEMALERAIRKAEKNTEAEWRAELERLRSQNIELLQTITVQEREANEQIRALEAERASLREELAGIRGKD